MNKITNQYYDFQPTQSQAKLREWHRDVSVCSLRDVRKVNKFLNGFMINLKQYFKYPRNRIMRSINGISTMLLSFNIYIS